MVYGPTNSGKTYTIIGDQKESEVDLKKNDSPYKQPRDSPQKLFTPKRRGPLSQKYNRSSSAISIFRRKPDPQPFLGTPEPRKPSEIVQPQGQQEMHIGMEQLLQTLKVEISKDGILPRALRLICEDFNSAQNQVIRENYDLKMSVLEIYNDQLTDLLQGISNPKEKELPLKIKESGYGSKATVLVQNL